MPTDKITLPELNDLANKTLNFNADGQWQKRSKADLNNALLVLIHISGCLLFEKVMNAHLTQDEAEKNAGDFGQSIRESCIRYLGYDPHEMAQDFNQGVNN